MVHLTPTLVLVVLLVYFAMLVGVAWFTGRNTSNEGFFLANRKVPWYVVAYAMIGTSISGVTFISIPGAVGGTGINMAFSYMQVVLGYLAGYLFIATVLMPLYYRLNLTSIYGYLEQRFGWWSYKTGAGFFLLSRTLGSAARMFLAASVLQLFVFGPLGVPFAITVILMLALIYGYTFKGGLKTIIWTDSIMTTFFLAALVFTVWTIGKALNFNGGELFSQVMGSKYGQVFFFKNFLSDPNHFVKQFVSGALVAIAMTGLDQDLMQKNLACKNIREAQKNMFVFCIYLVIINFLFLVLGALLYMYAGSIGLEIPARTDQLYPKIAFGHLDTWPAYSLFWD
jgi:Na+/proline symporter